MKKSTLRFLVVALLLVSCCTLRAQGQNDKKDPLAEKTPAGMVYVPGGDFTMGTNQSEAVRPNVARQYNDAQPEHKVTLPPFYIDKTEVTNAEYKRYCDATGYQPPPHWQNGAYPKGEDTVPVTHINWYEAAAYAAWTGKRLPTETEWEKAARGTDSRLYPWGNSWDATRVIWHQAKPQPVGTRPGGASPYGVLDMAGNVFEWVANWYDAYPGAPLKFEEYGTIYKVIRGGGFDGFESIGRTYYRSVASPSTRSEWIGFRCAQDTQ